MHTLLRDGSLRLASNLISYSIITKPCFTSRDLKPQHFSSKLDTFTESELPWIERERIESKPCEITILLKST